MSSSIPVLRTKEDFCPPEDGRLVALLNLANQVRDGGRPTDSLSYYDEAIRLAQAAAKHSVNANLLANLWTNRGIALLAGNLDLREAIVCFDRAIAIREPLLGSGDAWIRYGLSAGWLNRAEALSRLGRSAELQEAISSYETALALIETLPMESHSLFPRRLAIAWSNRGIALERQHLYAAAAGSFRSAILALDMPAALQIGDRALLLAGAQANLGNILLRESEKAAEEIISLARQSLGLIASEENTSVAAAEIGLKARHVLCRAVAVILDTREHPSSDDLVSEATDAVEAGIALAGYWQQQDAADFQDLSCELFRFGCRIYQSRLPHFLSEFILENLSEGDRRSSRMRSAAYDALWRALRRIQSEAFELLNTPEFPKLQEELRQLCDAEAKLNAAAA